MTKTFDTICKEILGETYMSPTPKMKAAGPNNVAQTNTNASQQPQQTSPSQQPQPNANQPNIGDDELLNLLSQRMADEQFKQKLLQNLNNPQQPSNATNKPV